MALSDKIDTPLLVELHKYWRSKFSGSALPPRAAIDPGEIKPYLPWVFLMAVEHAPLRFSYRLIGTGIVDFLKRDYTGRMIDENTYGSNASRMFEIFASSVERRDVTAVRCPVFYAEGRELHDVCWTMMPLAANGRDIDYLFCGYVRVNTSASVDSGGLKHMNFNGLEIIRAPVFSSGGSA